MDMDKLKMFLMWSTVINGVLLILSVIGFALFGGLWGRIHIQLFDLNPASLNTAIYGLLGIYKIVWLVFNLVPFAVMAIMSKQRRTN